MEIDWDTIAAAAGITTALGGAALAVGALLITGKTEKRLQAARELLKEDRKIWLDIQDLWMEIKSFYFQTEECRNETKRYLYEARLKNPHLCLARDCVHHCETDFRCDKSEPRISKSAHCDSYCPRPVSTNQPEGEK